MRGRDIRTVEIESNGQHRAGCSPEPLPPCGAPFEIVTVRTYRHLLSEKHLLDVSWFCPQEPVVTVTEQVGERQVGGQHPTPRV